MLYRPALTREIDILKFHIGLCASRNAFFLALFEFSPYLNTPIKVKSPLILIATCTQYEISTDVILSRSYYFPFSIKILMSKCFKNWDRMVFGKTRMAFGKELGQSNDLAKRKPRELPTPICIEVYKPLRFVIQRFGFKFQCLHGDCYLQ